MYNLYFLTDSAGLDLQETYTDLRKCNSDARKI